MRRKFNGGERLHKVIICTVGTSLLTAWRKMNPGVEPESDAILEAFHQGTINSAESNSLEHLSLNKKYDYIYLLSTETEDGRFCASILKNFYIDQGFIYAHAVFVSGLNNNYHDFQTRGLPNLIKEMSKIYEDHVNAHIIISATGGYKAQTAFATLFGAIMGSEVVYIYEDFKNIISFPSMPLDFNRSYIKQYAHVFHQITSAPKRKEAREYIDSLPLPLQGFFEKSDSGYTYSPTGRIFLASLKKNQIPKTYTIRTQKNHSSIWADGVNDIERIDNPKVKMLFKRIFDTCDHVTSIYLDEMKNENSQEVYMEFIEIQNGALRYLVHEPRGSEYIKVEVLPGCESKALNLLGRKIYP